MDKTDISIDGTSLTIEDVVCVATNPRTSVKLSSHARGAIKQARQWVDESVLRGEVVYGVSTGFGNFKHKTISQKETEELQTNIARSHACGTGDPFDKKTVRASMLLRANSLSSGYSGVRVEVIEKLLELLNKNVYPYVPEQGSVGSSGDLAPLCHIILVLMGEGECIQNDKRVPTSEVFKENEIEPITLLSKEGLALSNGTNMQTAILVLALSRAANLMDTADAVAALSVEVLMGSRNPFDSRVSNIRKQVGQIHTSENVASVLSKSPIIDSHRGCNRVQDAYSLRCIPQVHGASRDLIYFVRTIVEREINAVTDNPLIFPEDNCAISAGNFHGEPIAQASDVLKIAVSELANISERRIAKMVDPATSEGLPAFLIEEKLGGLHSGLMIPQYVAASLVSENKTLAHPGSVDSIPTSANQEDHVSMGTIAARHASMIVENAEKVLAIELLHNTQAYEFRKPLEISETTSWIYENVRERVPIIEADRAFYMDIENLHSLVVGGSIASYVHHHHTHWHAA